MTAAVWTSYIHSSISLIAVGVSIDGAFEFAEQCVGHDLKRTGRTHIALTHHPFTILDVKQSQSRLVSLCDDNRMVQRLGDNVARLPRESPAV
jgi:hypothetical protein